MQYKKVVGLVVVVALAVGGYRAVQVAGTLVLPTTDEDVEAIVASADAQNEESYYRPQRTPLEIQQPNPIIQYNDPIIQSTKRIVQ